MDKWDKRTYDIRTKTIFKLINNKCHKNRHSVSQTTKQGWKHTSAGWMFDRVGENINTETTVQKK